MGGELFDPAPLVVEVPLGGVGEHPGASRRGLVQRAVAAAADHHVRRGEDVRQVPRSAQHGEAMGEFHGDLHPGAEHRAEHQHDRKPRFGDPGQRGQGEVEVLARLGPVAAPSAGHHHHHPLPGGDVQLLPGLRPVGRRGPEDRSGPDRVDSGRFEPLPELRVRGRVVGDEDEVHPGQRAVRSGQVVGEVPARSQTDRLAGAEQRRRPFDRRPYQGVVDDHPGSQASQCGVRHRRDGGQHVGMGLFAAVPPRPSHRRHLDHRHFATDLVHGGAGTEDDRVQTGPPRPQMPGQRGLAGQVTGTDAVDGVKHDTGCRSRLPCPGNAVRFRPGRG